MTTTITGLGMLIAFMGGVTVWYMIQLVSPKHTGLIGGLMLAGFALALLALA